jgi:DNA-binding XRE family transcriptional regulator
MFDKASPRAPDKDDKILAVLGANIRRERTARSVTQEKLAELADLNTRTIQKIESGSLEHSDHDPYPSGLGCKWDKLLPPTG